MFFDQDSVEKLLKCDSCRSRFDVPRALPCGQVICSKCLDKILAHRPPKQNEIDCDFCANRHQIPPDNFPIQALIQNLLHLKPKLVQEEKSQKRVNAERILEYVQTKLNDAKTDYECREQRLENYYELLKEEIDLTFESVIEDLSKSRQNAINAIDIYKNQDSVKLAKLKPNDDIERNFHLISKLKAVLDSKEEVKFSHVFRQLNLILSNYYYNKVFLRWKILNGKSIEVRNDVTGASLYDLIVLNLTKNDSIPNSLLEYKYITLSLLNIDRLSQQFQSDSYLLKYDFKSDFSGSEVSALNLVEICPMVNSKILAAFQFYHSSTNHFSTKFSVYKYNMDEKSIVASNEFLLMDNCRIAFLVYYNNYVLLVHSNSNGIYRMNLYDHTLTKLHENVALDFVPKSVAISNDKIYVLAMSEPKINVYNLGFAKIDTVGQSSKPSENFYLDEAWNIFINNSKIVYSNIHANKVSVLDEKDGKMFGSFKISTDNSLLYFDRISRLIRLNRRSKCLSIFYLNFELRNLMADLDRGSEAVEELGLSTSERDDEKLCIFERNLPNCDCNSIYSFVISDDGHLVVLDFDNYSLYFY